MNVLDLFSGIGGFSLGLERAGMRTVAFCEIEPYARAVLKKHWPAVPIYADVRALTAAKLAADGIRVDCICGGFPCQDISTAGKGVGIEGERSGLWAEYSRLIGEIRPQFVIVENVAALLGRGLDRVLGDLSSIGYDAEWYCISASALGAPHERDRVWIIAYPKGERCGEARQRGERQEERLGCLCKALDTNADCYGLEANADQETVCGENFYGEFSRRLGEMEYAKQWHGVRPIGCKPVGMDDGISSDVDRIRCLGNAVVPQIPEIIGRAIMNIRTD